MESLNKILDETREKFAPDKRTAVFDLTLEASGINNILKGETNIKEALEYLLSQADKNNLSLINEANILPDSSVGKKIYGLVNLSVCNLRSKPVHSAELVTQSILGTPVKIFKTGVGWSLIQTPDKYIAWVDNSGIFPVTHKELLSWENEPRLIYLPEYGHSFDNPDKNSGRVSDLVSGSILKFVSQTGSFYEVEFPDGRRGFVPKNDMLSFDKWISQAKFDGNSIINTAMRYMGVPYLWGGTSSKGFDCSGFTKTVYFLNGLILPRDASQQVLTGELVPADPDFENLQKGDLLFFGRKARENKNERITHVAISLGGPDYIHSSGRVMINSLDKSKSNFNKYRFDSFIRAKRILTSVDKDGVTKLLSNRFYNGEIDESK